MLWDFLVDFGLMSKKKKKKRKDSEGITFYRCNNIQYASVARKVSFLTENQAG